MLLDLVKRKKVYSRHQELKPELCIASAMLVTSDGRYLLQLRDNKQGLPLKNHWAFFGGEVEEGEDYQRALEREIFEELTYKIKRSYLFHEAIYAFPNHIHKATRKAYFMVPIEADEVLTMVQKEGAAMKLMLPSDMLLLQNIAPWDLSVVLMHQRKKMIFDL